MSGGEESIRTLDAFTRCTGLGCERMVYLVDDHEPRCYEHGGRDGIPSYVTDTDSGAFIEVRHMTLPGGDCE